MSVKPRITRSRDKVVEDRVLLAQIVAGLRSQGKVVVLANGCFDLLHVGHVRALEDARSRGDFLVVALNSDASMKAIKNRLPFVPQEERAEVVAALKAVDYVTFFSEETADALLAQLKPDILAKGQDYTEKTVPERATAKAAGIRVLIVGDRKAHSTSALIQRIRRRKP